MELESIAHKGALAYRKWIGRKSMEFAMPAEFSKTDFLICWLIWHSCK